MIPLYRRPLFPGTFTPIMIQETAFIEALKSVKTSNEPYVGIFLVQEEHGDAPITDLSQIHDVGVLALVSSIATPPQPSQPHANASSATAAVMQRGDMRKGGTPPPPPPPPPPHRRRSGSTGPVPNGNVSSDGDATNESASDNTTANSDKEKDNNNNSFAWVRLDELSYMLSVVASLNSDACVGLCFRREASACAITRAQHQMAHSSNRRARCKLNGLLCWFCFFFVTTRG